MHALDDLPLSTHWDVGFAIEQKIKDPHVSLPVITEMVSTALREESTITFNGFHDLNNNGCEYYKGGIQIRYGGKLNVGKQETPTFVIHHEESTFYIPEIILSLQSGVSIGDAVDSNFEFIRRFFIGRSQIQHFDRFKNYIWPLAFKSKLDIGNISFEFVLSSKFGVYRHDKDKNTGDFYQITFDQAKEIVKIATQISNGRF